MLLRVGDVRPGAADMQFSLLHRIRADESCKAPRAYDATSPTFRRKRMALLIITRYMRVRVGHN